MVYVEGETQADRRATSRRPRPTASASASPTTRCSSSPAARSRSSSTTATRRWTSSGPRTGVDGELYIVQARPETVASQRRPTMLESYVARRRRARCSPRAGRSARRSPPARRASISRRRRSWPSSSRARCWSRTRPTPDWEPVMKTAAAIVTNRGGRTCHAAIVARELGIPAVVGTGDAHDARSRPARRSRSRAPRATPGAIYAGEVAVPRRAHRRRRDAPAARPRS